MAIYSVVAIVKDLPYDSKRKEYSKEFNAIVHYSISFAAIFIFYLITLFSFGPEYPDLKKLICCDFVEKWYKKELKK